MKNTGSISEKKSPLNNAYRLGWLALLLIYAGLQSGLIITLPLTQEEGINLQVGRLMEQGYTPYSQIFTLANPLFVWLLGWMGQIGPSPYIYKSIFLLFSLLLLINTSIITRVLLGRQVALVAVFLLATAITFLTEGADLVAITPAMSLATLALGFVLRYLLTKQTLWLILSGMTWSMALFISTTVLTIGLTVVLFLIFLKTDEEGHLIVQPSFRERYQPIIIWLVAGLLTIGGGILVVTPQIQYLYHTHHLLRENIPLLQSANFVLIGRFIAFNIWLSLFAAYGLAHLSHSAHHHHPLWLIVLWGLAGFGWLMRQNMLRPVDIGILLPPLAIIAAWGLLKIRDDLIQRSQTWSLSPAKRHWGRIGLSIFLLSLYCTGGWQQLNAYLRQDISNEGDFSQLEQRPDMIAFIRQQTDPDACAIIDDATLAIAADRLPPPHLVALSQARISSGLLTEAALISQVTEANCAVVVFSKRKYYRHLPDFRNWAGNHYPNTQRFSKTKIHFK